MKGKKTFILCLIILFVSILCLFFVFDLKKEFEKLIVYNTEQSIKETPVFVEPVDDEKFFIPMINENIKITNERKFFELYNPKENDCFLKYELYFNDYDFLLTFDSVKPDKLESINLYDALKIGIYDVTIIIYPCDYNNNRMGTNYAKYNVLFEISKE